MADTKREIERKFEFTSVKAGRKGVPDLTGVGPIAADQETGTVHLDAVYYDTPDRRLAAASLTLRRRTGGQDAGWHLKFPIAPGVRDELRAPLSDTVPQTLADLVRSRVREGGLVPLVRLRSAREVRHLLDRNGCLLAELSTDTVHAERLPGGEAANWTEVEVELAEEVPARLLETIGRTLSKAGLKHSDSPSKLARALVETGDLVPATPPAPPSDTGEYVLAYLREQRDALIDYDPAVRRELADSVHQMRVATRRMRGAFKTYRKVIDRKVTDPIGEELKWLAGELGVDRDQEVLMERLQGHLAEVPQGLVMGPVRARLKSWNRARRSGSRRRTLAVLDSPRYLVLLDTLDALLAEPPLLSAATRPPTKTFPRAVLRDYERLSGRIDHALTLAPGEERDLALHEARKAAKRARYAAEAAVPALGRPSARLAKRIKKVQTLLGDHQDSVVARQALRVLAAQAQGVGESGFTWGLLYGREEALAQRRERELPEVWANAATPALRAALGG
ncbi:CHAD domain-containing protein [Streptomyces sp. NPDC006879]|uniref:CYTH and CHAD domain-containing protein n=1 Tax=Streptomyces sp. NPDC006879 TaxID=3364767 RepID=UPI00368BAFA7